MKIKSLLSTVVLASLTQVSCTNAPVVDGNKVFKATSEKVTVPIINISGQRYSTELDFNDLVKKDDGSYEGQVKITDLQPLYDSTDITMDKGFDPVIAKKLETFLKDQVDHFHKPGVVLRVEMQGKVWRGVAGKKRINAADKLNYSDRFRIGSITKTFMSNVIMQLVQEGKIKLTDTVGMYLPDVVIHNKDKITIRDLIAHRTGLFNYVKDMENIQKSVQIDPLRTVTPYYLIGLANSRPVEHEPGAQYGYSNTGLTLAGLIIEKVTGKSAEQVVEEKILKPLKLSRTEFPTDPGMQSNYMHGHADYNKDGVLQSTEIVTYTDPSIPWVAGAMVSNVEDISRWTKIYVDGVLLKPELQQQVLHDCMPSKPEIGAAYCLGMVRLTWPINTEPLTTTDPKQLWYGHLGQINGYDNVVGRNPVKDITAAMTNSNYYLDTPSEETNGAFLFQLMDILDPLPSKIAK